MLVRVLALKSGAGLKESLREWKRELKSNIQPGQTTAARGSSEHHAVGVEPLVSLHGGVTETTLGPTVHEARAEESLQAYGKEIY